MMPSADRAQGDSAEQRAAQCSRHRSLHRSRGLRCHSDVDATPDRQDTDLDFGHELGGEPCELLRRLAQHERVATEAEAAISPPVDRNGNPRTEQAERLRCATWVEVSGRQPRSPACDRQQRNVQVVGDRAHAREEIGVAREVGGRGARDEISDRRRLDAERPTPAFVLGVRRANRYTAYLRFVPGLDLDHVTEATSPQPGAGAARNDELRGAPERLERREIEVVVVDM